MEKSSARRMGGANGARECAPDDRLRDTHQLPLAQVMGFAKAQPIARMRALTERDADPVLFAPHDIAAQLQSVARHK